MIKKYAFCCEQETIDHLFFICKISKYVWSIMALTIGASCRPESIDQYMMWVSHFLPHGRKFYYAGLSATCWAIWKQRNRACFEAKLIRSPSEIVYYACVFLNYWAELLKDEDRQALEARKYTRSTPQQG